jgi:hypothetical protein
MAIDPRATPAEARVACEGDVSTRRHDPAPRVR